MKQFITFEITGNRASGVLLLHVVVVLLQLHINPAALSWERSENANENGVGMLVLSGAAKLPDLLAALRITDGFCNVLVESATPPSAPASG